MRGLTVLLVVIGVVAVRAQVETCPTEQEADWTIEKLLRHEDCNKFYKCTHGKPVEYTCFGDLYFNLETWECDWQGNVDCEGRIEPEPAPEPTDAPTEAPLPECKPVDVETLPNGCPVDPHIPKLLPHENDCGLFYYCVWGELVQHNCPEKLHFNPDLQVCDVPEFAGCAVSASRDAKSRRRFRN